MKLATLKRAQHHNPSDRDDALVLGSRDLSRCQFVPETTSTLNTLSTTGTISGPV